MKFTVLNQEVSKEIYDLVIDMNIEITKLETQLKREQECVDFYADINNYCDNDMLGIPSHMVNHKDDEFISTMEGDYKYDRSLGGKRARETVRMRGN